MIGDEGPKGEQWEKADSIARSDIASKQKRRPRPHGQGFGEPEKKRRAHQKGPAKSHNGVEEPSLETVWAMSGPSKAESGGERIKFVQP